MANTEVDKEISILVGNQIRIARNLKKISQSQLSKALGISFQQIQKYEKATNRISATKLMQAAKFFNLPISFFFQEETHIAELTLIEDRKVRQKLRELIHLLIIAQSN